MKKVAQAILVFLVIFLVGSTQGSAQDGKILYLTKFCVVCHGRNGVSVDPNYPTLAQQNELYLINQMHDILTKKRANKFTLLMTEHPVVNHVSTEEISAISKYLHSEIIATTKHERREVN